MTTQPLPNPETREGQEMMKKMGLVPFPVPDDLTRPFWDAANKGQLVMQKCAKCSAYQHPPQAKCHACGGEPQWTPISGKGTVFTYIIDYRNEVPGFDGPYVFAFVNPDESKDDEVRLTGNVMECDVKDVYIGMPVEVFYKDVKPGIAMPQWRPAAGAKLRSKGQTP